MNFKERLLSRLDEIGHSLRDSGNALALLGLGSCGQETDRLDDYSDLDFFAIVDNGSKWRFINSLDWLERVGPIAYALRNTADGYKLMFEDGIFCEFAVFEPHELANIPFAPGRVVWQQPWFDARCCEPKIDRAPEPSRDIHWLVGEAVTNLYVGMGRYRRGEKVSAARFIQQYAFDRLLDLCQLLAKDDAPYRDPFVFERRIEQRFSHLNIDFASMQQGIERCPESALAQLAFLRQHFEVNPAMSARIEALCIS